MSLADSTVREIAVTSPTARWVLSRGAAFDCGCHRATIRHQNFDGRRASNANCPFLAEYAPRRELAPGACRGSSWNVKVGDSRCHFAPKLFRLRGHRAQPFGLPGTEPQQLVLVVLRGRGEGNQRKE